jgi:Raf kinase inhibitor-like YbhB/YbcL family protein
MRIISTSFLALAMVVLTSFSKLASLSVTSSAFSENGMIPLKYSCEGDEAIPPLHIGAIPAGAKTLAIILHDPDAPMAGGFTHWVVWNIGVDADIPENFSGGEIGLNSMGKHNYKGMCPPSGKHRYYFMVYALDTKLAINANTDKAGLEKAMQGHILAEGTLIGLYRKVK